ncbi:MAG: gamma-glutamyl-gamma-aminobutyrate hydrolase family protein [Gemmataceae bacterium]|nr:gamma-glutamyl-gamma-aminobutyrate hydrolase family protein [Gemmataceae bacterium]MCI0740359.1 gamma-glutamyl-gamma-aminobutyrate hydrolase family protein [Gemmataceae bacterium]
MFASPSAIRLAVYGSEIARPGRGVGLWNAGYKGTIIAAGAEPVFLEPAKGDAPWSELLVGCKGVVVCGFDKNPSNKQGDAESLCLWCRSNRFPLLVIDQGMLAMNAAYGGINYEDLPRELPDALQHRHPPEPGLRHAILVQPGTQLSQIYGEGEIVVNSEHRQAIQRLASGFRIGATALDGVIEAVESTNETWFAMGVQWQPASPSASGLDIQVFRAVIDAGNPQAKKPAPVKQRKLAMAG